MEKKDQKRPDDFQKRLEDILIRCAIIPSFKKGFIQDTQAMTICGDASALETGASPVGKPSCQCRQNGIYDCQHARYYSDPTANWGYDSYRDCYYKTPVVYALFPFGHTFYQHVVSALGHDLPLYVNIECV